jgi:hypothetical protein
MSRDALEQRLTRHTTTAARACPSLAGKTITPHVLRHTAAMRLKWAELHRAHHSAVPVNVAGLGVEVVDVSVGGCLDTRLDLRLVVADCIWCHDVASKSVALGARSVAFDAGTG